MPFTARPGGRCAGAVAMCFSICRKMGLVPRLDDCSARSEIAKRTARAFSREFSRLRRAPLAWQTSQADRSSAAQRTLSAALLGAWGDGLLAELAGTPSLPPLPK